MEIIQNKNTKKYIPQEIINHIMSFIMEPTKLHYVLLEGIHPFPWNTKYYNFMKFESWTKSEYIFSPTEYFIKLKEEKIEQKEHKKYCKNLEMSSNYNPYSEYI